MVNRPEWIHAVLERDAWNFSIVRVLTIDRALRQGLLTSTGYLHQHQRQLLAEPFHAWVATATDLIARNGVRLRERGRAGATFDMRRAMLRVCLDVITEAIFGVDPASEPAELREAGLTVCQYLSRPSTHPLASAKEAAPLLPDNRRFWTAMRVLDAAIFARIVARRAQGSASADLLQLLLDVRDPASDAGLTDRQVRDELITLYTAGVGPMAWALTRAWYLLSQHPAAEARLHAELDSVLGGRPPDSADLEQLSYTRMVIQETLRLYPSAWIFGRNVLSDYDLDGYLLPVGALVVLSSYVTQRDARYWPEPTRFQPERWTPAESARRPPGVYFPFGGGPRSCFGAPLAMLIMTTLLATLASSWRPRFVSGQPDAFQARFTLRLKEPMLMRLEMR
jgi:cytochrome P450